MTRRSITALERDLEDLEDVAAGDGFHVIQIGGDPDKSGYYSWNNEKGVYENDAAVEIPPEDAPDSGSEFEWGVKYE